MRSIGQITSLRADEFDAAALEIFRFQAERCEPYRRYLSLMGFNADDVRRASDIPHLPIELFKTEKVYCGPSEPEKCFTSSTTGGGEASMHYMYRLADYEAAFMAAYDRFYGAMPLYALLPCYLEREGSSLVYMADRIIARYGGGFYLDDYDRLSDALAADGRPKILLGVSYALWDMAERRPQKLADTIVMETGGMKGRRREMPKSEFHALLCDAFGVGTIHSEYGMAELSSQAYSSGGGIFRTPQWMKVSVRDANDPLAAMPCGARGGINITDLANRYSCAFIQTQDAGRVFADGTFELSGRLTGSDIRGCNLLVQ